MTTGVILAIDDVLFHDQGAYVRTHATRVVHMTAGILPGPYRVPAYRSIGHFRLTNKTPAATYRAPGRYETTFVRERLVDAIAAKLGIDRIEVRRRNAIGPRRCRIARPLEALGEEIHYDTGDYIGLLDKLFATIDWEKLNADVQRRQAAGELVGVGVAMFVEKSGLGPTDGVNISVDTSGMVEVVTGGASLGQGFETVMAQVAADALGVDYRRCRVIHGQTDRIAYGIGAHASRATVMTASATHIAALNVREKALAVGRRTAAGAARRARHRRRRGGAQGSQRRPVDQPRRDRAAPCARHRRRWATASRALPPKAGSRPSIRSIPTAATSPLCASIAETGGVAVERYFIAYDIGRAINPALVEGQIVGGFAQGLGGALFEEFTYQRARRSARRHLRRLSHADRARDAGARNPAARGLRHAAQSARHQGRRRKRHHRRRRRHRLRHRRRHRHSRRGDASFRSRRSGSSGFWISAATNLAHKANSSAATRSGHVANAGSLRLDARGLDHLGPLLGFSSDEFPEFGGRHRHRLSAEVGKSCLHRRDRRAQR